MNRKLRDFLLMTGGTVLVAIGLYYFKMPNHFSTGGVSGISIILGALIPGLSTGTINFLINMLLLLLGFSLPSACRRWVPRFFLISVRLPEELISLP